MRRGLAGERRGTLPRKHFFTLLEATVGRLRSAPVGEAALLLIKIDCSEAMRCALGPIAEARVRREAIARLVVRINSKNAPADRQPIAGKLGGGLVAIFLETVSDRSEATELAAALQDALKEPITSDGDEIWVTVSVGIAFAGAETEDTDAMLRCAESALLHARSLGRSSRVVCTSEMRSRIAAGFRLENELYRAFDRDELCLVYQPIVALQSRALHGFEALVRWRHPSGRTLNPGEFIPVAEASGQIVALDRWVLRAACRQVRAWQNQLGEQAVPVISVNMSGAQLSRPDCSSEVERTLRNAGVYGRALSVEITESEVMAHARYAEGMLSQLRHLRIRVSIDDFGTGYSSLANLRRFAPDVLKIDRSFIARLDGDEDSLAIVRSVVALATNLGKSVIAEGVETAAQAAALIRLGCPLGQGFYFAPPLPPEQAGQMMANSSCDSLFHV